MVYFPNVSGSSRFGRILERNEFVLVFFCDLATHSKPPRSVPSTLRRRGEGWGGDTFIVHRTKRQFRAGEKRFVCVL